MTVPEGVHDQAGHDEAQIAEAMDLGEATSQTDPGALARAGRWAAGLAVSAYVTLTELGNHLPLTAFKGRQTAEEAAEQESVA